MGERFESGLEEMSGWTSLLEGGGVGSLLWGLVSLSMADLTGSLDESELSVCDEASTLGWGVAGAAAVSRSGSLGEAGVVPGQLRTWADAGGSSILHRRLWTALARRLKAALRGLSWKKLLPLPRRKRFEAGPMVA